MLMPRFSITLFPPYMPLFTELSPCRCYLFYAMPLFRADAAAADAAMLAMLRHASRRCFYALSLRRHAATPCYMPPLFAMPPLPLMLLLR